MSWEIHIINLIRSIQSPLLDAFMQFMTQLGSGTFIAVFGGIFIAVFLWRKEYRSAFVFAALLLGQEIIVRGLKNIIARPRPEVLSHLTYASGFSFPSGHTVATLVFWGFLAYYFSLKFPQKSYRILIYSLAAVTVFLVGFSRVYLGVHWISDVLGGYVIAFLWVFLVFRLFFRKER